MRIAQACPPFAPTKILRSTSKNAVAAGTFRGQRAILKLALSDDPTWLSWLEREQWFYRSAALSGPAVACPDWLADGSDPYFLVMTALEGMPLSTDRLMPSLPLPIIEALARSVETIGAWTPDRPREEQHPVAEAIQRCERYAIRGHLSEAQFQLFATRIGNLRAALTFAHGDLVASNIFRHRADSLGFIDWEHSGRKIAGYDLALIWIMSALSPSNQRALLPLISRRGDDAVAAFLINLLLLSARERQNYLTANLAVTSRLVRSLDRSMAQITQGWQCDAAPADILPRLLLDATD